MPCLSPVLWIFFETIVIRFLILLIWLHIGLVCKVILARLTECRLFIRLQVVQVIVQINIVYSFRWLAQLRVRSDLGL